MTTGPQFGKVKLAGRPRRVLPDEVRGVINRIRSGNAPAGCLSILLWAAPVGIALSFQGESQLVRLDQKGRHPCPRTGEYLAIPVAAIVERLEAIWPLVDTSAPSLELALNETGNSLILRGSNSSVELPLEQPTPAS